MFIVVSYFSCIMYLLELVITTENLFDCTENLYLYALFASLFLVYLCRRQVWKKEILTKLLLYLKS